MATGPEPFALSVLVLFGFLCIVTNPGCSTRPRRWIRHSPSCPRSRNAQPPASLVRGRITRPFPSGCAGSREPPASWSRTPSTPRSPWNTAAPWFPRIPILAVFRSSDGNTRYDPRTHERVHPGCVGCENQPPRGVPISLPDRSNRRATKAVVQSAFSPSGACATAPAAYLRRQSPNRRAASGRLWEAGGNKSIREVSFTGSVIRSACTVGDGMGLLVPAAEQRSPHGFPQRIVGRCTRTAPRRCRRS